MKGTFKTKCRISCDGYQFNPFEKDGSSGAKEERALSGRHQALNCFPGAKGNIYEK